MNKLFESRAAVLELEARERVLDKEIELAKLKRVQPESLPAFDVEVAMERLCKVAFTAGADDVVEALRAELLAAAALPTPLTDEQIGKAWAVADGEHNASASVKRRITRAIEKAHGIGAKP